MLKLEGTFLPNRWTAFFNAAYYRKLYTQLKEMPVFPSLSSFYSWEGCMNEINANCGHGSEPGHRPG